MSHELAKPAGRDEWVGVAKGVGQKWWGMVRSEQEQNKEAVARVHAGVRHGEGKEHRTLRR